MIVPDANLLLYAYNEDAPQHAAAKAWLEDAFSQPGYFGLSWQVITAFVRISTNSKAFPIPFSPSEATGIVDEWLVQPQVRILAPTEGHWRIFSTMLINEQISGPLVMDAHLATLATEHGGTLATTDRDFRRFPTLKVIFPLD